MCQGAWTPAAPRWAEPSGLSGMPPPNPAANPATIAAAAPSAPPAAAPPSWCSAGSSPWGRGARGDPSPWGPTPPSSARASAHTSCQAPWCRRCTSAPACASAGCTARHQVFNKACFAMCQVAENHTEGLQHSVLQQVDVGLRERNVTHGLHRVLQESRQQADVNGCRTRELPHAPWHVSVGNLQRKAAGRPGRHAQPRTATGQRQPCCRIRGPGTTQTPAPASLPGPARAGPPPARWRASGRPV